jgi:hypothetical protein
VILIKDAGMRMRSMLGFLLKDLMNMMITTLEQQRTA